MTSYTLNTEADRKLAMSRLTTVPVDGKWKCEIKRSEKRRDAQNRLLWRWNTAIAEQMYDSKDDVHVQNKHRFGVPILSRDDDKFNAVWTALANDLNYAEQLQALRYIDVTSIMLVKQMTEYLSDMELYYERNGIMLPKKDDEYFEALGFTRRVA